jgi:hypothetical protein
MHQRPQIREHGAEQLRAERRIAPPGARSMWPSLGILGDWPSPCGLGCARMPRRYVPHEEKHKWPKGYGSLCPRMPAAEPGELLSKAIPVPGVGENKLWVASGR